MTSKNELYYGDNLKVLREHIADDSVDLVYLDPPFKSNVDYNAFFEEKDGSKSASQIKAFEDTWEWDTHAAAAYQEVVESGGDVSKAMQAFRTLLGENDMLAYLSMMAPRLIELRRVLKETGSIYLHCDPTASHYLKLLMDSIFGPGNFKNEIIWSYKRYTAAANRFQRLHDVLLFYSKTKEAYFNPIRDEYGENSGKADSHYKQDENGQWFRWQKRKGQEPYKIYLSEGRRVGDVWDIPTINASAKERLGYPTQKPEALLSRILEASTQEGDVVLDPFCGCGTTVSVAQHLKRKWIGIDITQLAITLIKNRLVTAFGSSVRDTFHVTGEPESLNDAKALAQEDAYQFQLWALGLVDARPAGTIKKGADKGIDGRLYFHETQDTSKTSQIIISVKGGHLKPEYVRELPGIVDREKAQLGVLISLEAPTKPMRAEAASAGFYDSPFWGKFPKIQLLTVEELLNGAKINYPLAGKSNVSLKAAPKAKTKSPQPTLF